MSTTGCPATSAGHGHCRPVWACLAVLGSLVLDWATALPALFARLGSQGACQVARTGSKFADSTAKTVPCAHSRSQGEICLVSPGTASLLRSLQMTCSTALPGRDTLQACAITTSAQVHYSNPSKKRRCLPSSTSLEYESLASGTTRFPCR